MVDIGIKVYMGLSLKSMEVEQLAAEVAALAKKTKIEAIRKALIDRKERLIAEGQTQTRSERAASILQQFWDRLPPEHLGRPLSREEEDEILGFGPGGV